MTSSEWALKACSAEGLSDEDIKYWLNWIESASQEDMAAMYRFAPAGHPLFHNNYQNIRDAFDDKWNGWNPKLSKKVGHIQ